jgi:hypothetical protein
MFGFEGHPGGTNPIDFVGTKPGSSGSISMEYRGIKYTITQETRPEAWRGVAWRTVVGNPPRCGEARPRLCRALVS